MFCGNVISYILGRNFVQIITLNVRVESEYVKVSPANQMASKHCGYQCTLKTRVSQSRPYKLRVKWAICGTPVCKHLS